MLNADRNPPELCQLRYLSAQVRHYIAVQLMQRRLVFLLMIAALFIAGMSFGAFAIVLNSLQLESQQMHARIHQKNRIPVHAPNIASAGMVHALPVFSSAEFGREFLTHAVDAGLAVDEVAYVLDASASQPYLRYRVSLPVKTRYAEIRKFVAALEAAMPNVLLDSVRCSRESAGAAQLSCDLAFSALFAKT